MSYLVKFDRNGNRITEAISEVEEIEVAAGTVLTDAVITVPRGVYGVVFKRLPVDAKIKINGQTTGITVDAGDVLSPFIDGITQLTITTTTTDASPIVVQFIK